MDRQRMREIGRRLAMPISGTHRYWNPTRAPNQPPATASRLRRLWGKESGSTLTFPTRASRLLPRVSRTVPYSLRRCRRCCSRSALCQRLNQLSRRAIGHRIVTGVGLHWQRDVSGSRAHPDQEATVAWFERHGCPPPSRAACFSLDANLLREPQACASSLSARRNADNNWAAIRIEAGGAMSIGSFDTARQPVSGLPQIDCLRAFDQLLRPKLNTRYVIEEETVAGTRGNGRDAPKPIARRPKLDCWSRP